MTQYNKLIDLGLDEMASTLLTTPIIDLGRDERTLAIQAYDLRIELIREANKGFKLQLKPFHNIISDNMDRTLNPMNGKHYDSKSAYYKAVKEAGGVIMGNEKQAPKKEFSFNDDQIKRDIYATAKQLGHKL